MWRTMLEEVLHCYQCFGFGVPSLLLAASDDINDSNVASAEMGVPVLTTLKVVNTGMWLYF